jgi:hypothetical protein
MVQPSKQTCEAVSAVIQRLFQMRQLWQDAANNYFEPSRFALSLQNCITTSRTVTFILQSNKAAFDNFDAWYETWRNRWNADPIMRWARDARNSIEKVGDLKTHSQVRAEIIASYDEGPKTEWMPQALIASPIAIWQSVPAKFRIPQVVEHGTLLIERRWVDSGLSDTEVLEALAHVYAEFCLAINDLLKNHRMKAPPQLDRSRPDAMGELAMDRAIYLSMKDGSPQGMRYFKRPLEPPTEKSKKIVAKRYGKAGSNWSRLKSAKNLREVAEAFFTNARVVMARDGMHHSFTFLFKGIEVVQMIRTDHPTRASRYVLMRDLARFARIVDADGVMMIAEVWTAQRENIPSSGYAVEATDRGEALSLVAATRNGKSFGFQAEIVRKKPGSRKVKSIGPTEVEEGGFPFMFLPFFQLWGSVDEEAMQRAFDQMDEWGIETPEIPKD